MYRRDLVLNVFDYNTRLDAEGVRQRAKNMYGEHLSPTYINVLLADLAKKGDIFRLRQGWYCLPDSKWTRNGRRARIDETAPSDDVVKGTFVPSGRYA